MAKELVSKETKEVEYVVDGIKLFLTRHIHIERDGDATITNTMLFSLGGDLLGAERVISVPTEKFKGSKWDRDGSQFAAAPA